MIANGKDPIRKTWDGLEVSPDPPYAASVIVYRRGDGQLEYLLLHRAHSLHDDQEWAWGPPGGARFPGEPIVECAKRELIEETGENLPCTLTKLGSEACVIFMAEWPADALVTLSEEHDDFRWSPVEGARELCLPKLVAEPFLLLEELLDPEGRADQGGATGVEHERIRRKDR